MTDDNVNIEADEPKDMNLNLSLDMVTGIIMRIARHAFEQEQRANELTAVLQAISFATKPDEPNESPFLDANPPD